MNALQRSWRWLNWGNNEQLKEIYCELKTGTHFQQLDVIGKKLPYIRGWFSIWLTDQLIERRIEEGRMDKKALARLAPDASLPDLASTSKYWILKWHNVPRKLEFPSTYEWRKYVEENRELLSKLEPRAADLINNLPDCKGRHNSKQ